ncbi:hypothetical protein SAMN05421681_11196 [Lysobacter enzymogenes]|nr:hypothetical protein SAMN05421681_11196 [Lysobacter enzymogenes]
MNPHSDGLSPDEHRAIFEKEVVPRSGLYLQDRLVHFPLAATSGVVQLAAHAVGLWLVFSAPGREWFRARQK